MTVRAGWWVCVHSGLAAHIQVLVPPSWWSVSKGLVRANGLKPQKTCRTGSRPRAICAYYRAEENSGGHEPLLRIRPSKFESQILMLKKESNLQTLSFYVCKMEIKNTYA